MRSTRAFWAKFLTDWLVVQALVTLAMATLGTAFYPEADVRYAWLFAPLVYATLGLLPNVILWSRRELSVRQTWVRRGFHLVVLEALMVPAVVLPTSPEFNWPLVPWVALSILVIWLAVCFVDWLRGSRDAGRMTAALTRFAAAPER